jgi:hypothetical protein
MGIKLAPLWLVVFLLAGCAKYKATATLSAQNSNDRAVTVNDENGVVLTCNSYNKKTGKVSGCALAKGRTLDDSVSAAIYEINLLLCPTTRDEALIVFGAPDHLVQKKKARSLYLAR